MPSFDIVSEIDNEEVRNSVENAERELSSRFDFRGVDASFEWTKDGTTVKAEADFQLEQLLDILRSKLVKRGVDTSAMDISEPIHSGKTFSQTVKFKEGIDTPTAKKIVKIIKDSKLKVQASIQGDQVRINGKKRDDLQAVIALMKEKQSEVGQPLQFNNFRD